MEAGLITIDGMKIGTIEINLAEEVGSEYNVGDGGRGLGAIIGNQDRGGHSGGHHLGHGGGYHPGGGRHGKNQHHFPGHRPASTGHDTPHDSHFDSDIPKSKGSDATGPVDRSSFSDTLDDPAFVRKMASMGKGEVGLTSDLKTQRAIAEQAFNRWYVRKQEAGRDLYHGKGGYYAGGTFQPVSDAEVEKYRREVLEPVIKGGTNEAKGTTGNASNEPGNEVAKHQFERGTPGYWMNLKTGEKTDLPNSYQGGKAEALFHEGPYKRQLKMKESSPVAEMPTSTIAPLLDNRAAGDFANSERPKTKIPTPMPSPIRAPGSEHYGDLKRSDNIEDRRGDDPNIKRTQEDYNQDAISGVIDTMNRAEYAETHKPNILARQLGAKDIPKSMTDEEWEKAENEKPNPFQKK